MDPYFTIIESKSQTYIEYVRINGGKALGHKGNKLRQEGGGQQRARLRRTRGVAAGRAKVGGG